VEWKIYPKGDQYTQEELKNFVGSIANAVKYYKTGYKDTGVGKKGTLQTPATVKMKTIKDWAKLVLTLDATSITKITNSQPAGNDNLYQKLFKDMRDNNTFTANFSIDSVDEISGKTRKSILIQQAANLRLEVDNKRGEIGSKITQKETEIDNIVKEIITKKREALTTYKLDKGFEKITTGSTTEDNRQTKSDLELIKTLLEDIRFLEKNDTSQNSTESGENAAYTTITEILDKVNLTATTAEDETKDIYLVNIYEGYNKSDSEALTEFAKQTSATGKTLTDL
jgi:hypothetical protein